MNIMKKSGLVIGLVILSTAVFRLSFAQEVKAGLIVESAPQKTISQVAEEKITVENNGDVGLDVGVLEIVLPSQFEFVSANPAITAKSGQKISFAVPALASGASFTVRYVVLPVGSSKDANTTVNYLVGGKIMTGTQVKSEINPISGGQVAGVETPRTGMDANIVLLFGLLTLGMIGRQLKPVPVK